jgi:DNA-binding Xre family transcriptional regulator
MIWDGTQLKAICDKRGVSKTKLASQLGVSRPTVYGWLSGQIPRGDHLLMLCSILGIDPNDLFSNGVVMEAPSRYAPSSSTGKLFKKSGLKLIYALLTDPGIDQASGNNLLNASVRELATETNISAGSASELLSEMDTRGFLLHDGPIKRLISRKALFDQWINGYRNYRFKLKRQPLRAASIDWWTNRNPPQDGFLWGSEPAGAILTDGFLQPETLTLFTDAPLYDLIVDENLQPAPDGGNVEFVETPFIKREINGCVHPLLVCADLICSDDDRNAETSARIYDRYLRQIIDPD